MSALTFEISHRCRSTHARVGRVVTRHGAFDTPAFMPVGTKGTVKGILPHLVAQTGAQIILGNTYHLLLRPGPDLVARRGGLHPFIGWPGPILTDSGGYQAYSMADIVRLDDEAVTFKSIVDGSMIALSPERAMEVQNAAGRHHHGPGRLPASVDPSTFNQTRQRLAAQQTIRTRKIDHASRLDGRTSGPCWLERCKASHSRPDEQSLFGIVRGDGLSSGSSWSAERVCRSTSRLRDRGCGGGEGFEQIVRVVEHTAPLLPEAKPRYLMGVGYERDLVAAVRAGVDMFDCVLPTRGRNANAFTPTGQIRLRNAGYAEDDRPIDGTRDCYACRPGLHGWQTVSGRPFSRRTSVTCSWRRRCWGRSW